MTVKRNDGNIFAKDQARTPKQIFDALDKEFHFDIDVAADENNTLCTSFFALHNPVVDNPMQLTKLPLAIDALNQDWVNWTRVGAKTFFCNPPYSAGNILKFVHKAWLESGNGATVVLLIPSDPSTEYFEFCFENASEIRFMHPRVKFNNPDGTPMKSSPPMGSMIVVFKPGEHGPAKMSMWRWKEE